ncbi:histidine kinase N-terminal 7TM domain-containing diguanylate cyclase [Actinoplanes awajinensis]|uniref:GGDEF domain-containing protein n=1 Tax=Actinoplanes awajinensis subsp. mycoplanecinus TaxID=135947 RepID=A0A117ML53_9ACTN|nr:diguanylate cyclase [Actinoplanes awajinensis]KUL23171.1 hypothetical protein ADL15_46775 [Actinoplanes awajinensis subsp. mycoplanecinus]
MRAALVTVYVAAALLAAAYAVLSWRRRHLSPLATSLSVITAGGALWSLAQSVAITAASPAVARVGTYAMFPGVAMIIAGFLWHTSVFTGRRPGRLALLLVHPVLLVAVVLTDPWHHAFFSSITSHPDGGVTPHPGWAYWLHAAYCYAMLALGTARATGAMRRAVHGHRRVFVIFLGGALVPAVGNLVSLFVAVGDRQADLTPVLFLVTATMWWWAERSGVPARRLPVAYKQVIAALSDAVMVLDPDGQFLDVNPAAAEMLAALNPASTGAVVGRPWSEIAGRQLASVLTGTDEQTVAANGRMYDVRVVRMHAADGGSPGTVVVVRDVTELERLRAELTDHAVRDGLTGVFNRRHLTAVLRDQVHEAGPLSAVMIDVDHFKAVNDTYGHAVGDEVLTRLAQEISDAAGPAAVVARYGGEEFAVILPGVAGKAAADLVEQWRLRCAQLSVATRLGPLRVTFSAGVAQLASTADAEDLLRRADRALYAAKEQGRNRVVCDTAARSSPPSRVPAAS